MSWPEFLSCLLAVTNNLVHLFLGGELHFFLVVNYSCHRSFLFTFLSMSVASFLLYIFLVPMFDTSLLAGKLLIFLSQYILLTFFICRKYVVPAPYLVSFIS